jgi:hypothetical protein
MLLHARRPASSWLSLVELYPLSRLDIVVKQQVGYYQSTFHQTGLVKMENMNPSSAQLFGLWFPGPPHRSQ